MSAYTTVEPLLIFENNNQATQLSSVFAIENSQATSIAIALPNLQRQGNC